MEKKDLIFLAASVLMINHETNKNIVNLTGQAAFKKYFTIYQRVLNDLYEVSPKGQVTNLTDDKLDKRIKRLQDAKKK